MSSSPFQITGIASGISWDEIIDEMLTAARKPKEQWQSQIDTLELKKTLYQEVQSTIFDLRSSMTALKLPSAYKKKTAEFVVRRSDAGAVNAENIIKATVNADAAIAQWDIDVKQLAQAQSHVSKRFDGAGDELGISGKIRLQVGIQVAELEIEASDSIRTINQKIGKLTAADGSALAVTAQLIDNRLVISGALTGRDTEGPLAQQSLSMYDTIKDKDGQLVTYLPHYATFADDDPNKVEAGFPKQLYSVKVGSTTYREGADFKYDATNGAITWLTGGKQPKAGDQIDVTFGGDLKLDSNDSTYTSFTSLIDGSTKTAYGRTQMPALSTGKMYEDLPGGANFDTSDPDWQKKLAEAYVLYDKDGYKLEFGTDYEFMEEDGKQYIVWLKSGAVPGSTDSTAFRMTAAADNNYYVSNRQLHLLEDGMDSYNSVLYKLGFTDLTTDAGKTTWKYENVTYATDAQLTVNGVSVTRPTNQIPVEDDESDALIANVKLELTGTGRVTMNITQDATEIIENMEKFVEAYNKMMELINYRLEETAEKNSSSTSDALSSILENSRGDTSFGLLHGDQLLWSVKNQMRRYISEPISAVSSDLRSKKYLWPAAALELTGSLYVNAGAMQARIDIAAADSLEDIQRKLNTATAINSTDGGKTATGKELGLEAVIEDGQLVVKRASKFNGSMTEQHTVTRDAAAGYDLIPFVPRSTAPVNGVLKVTSGGVSYVEGTDFEIQNVENDNGVLETRVVWNTGANAPKPGSTYSVNYEYAADGVGYSLVPNSGDLSTLGLHYDASSVELSTYGITTTANDYGKSGEIEFDSDKFFAGIQNDTDMLSKVMLSFMEKMDNYIGNLVDSSNLVVGGNIVTKGRFAAAINRIDTQVSDLQERIDRLERQLEDKQNALYKQYADMEQAIQLMNAQMSSIAQYLSSSASSGGGNSNS